MASFDFVLGGKHWRAQGEVKQWSVGPLKQNKKTGKVELDAKWFYASTDGMMRDLLEAMVRTDPNVTDFEGIQRAMSKYKDYLSGLYRATDKVKEMNLE